MTASRRRASMRSPCVRAVVTPVIPRQASRDTSCKVGRPETLRPDSGPLLASPQAQAIKSMTPQAQPKASRSAAGADLSRQGFALLRSQSPEVHLVNLGPGRTVSGAVRTWSPSGPTAQSGSALISPASHCRTNRACVTCPPGSVPARASSAGAAASARSSRRPGQSASRDAERHWGWASTGQRPAPGQSSPPVTRGQFQRRGAVPGRARAEQDAIRLIQRAGPRAADQDRRRVPGLGPGTIRYPVGTRSRATAPRLASARTHRQNTDLEPSCGKSSRRLEGTTPSHQGPPEVRRRQGSTTRMIIFDSCGQRQAAPLGRDHEEDSKDRAS